MALRFMDGFDHYATAEFDQKYSASNSATIDLVDRRTGLGSLKMTGTTPHITVGLNAQTTWIVGFGIKLSSQQTIDDQDLISFMDGSSYTTNDTHISLQILGDGNFRVIRSTELSPTVIATGTTRVALDDGWHYLEFKVFHHDTLGTFELRIDEENVFSGTGLDTINDNATNPTSSHIRISRIEGGVTTTWVDDLYVCDGTGSKNSDFLGDCEVTTIFPKGEGNLEDFTPSAGGSNYTFVDENPPDDDDTYVESNTSGNKDSHDMDDVSSMTVIPGVQLTLFSRFLTGAASIKHLVRTSGSNFLGGTKVLTAAYVFDTFIWEQEPDDPSDWTVSVINASEFGMEVV